jgi:hypothetical protein
MTLGEYVDLQHTRLFEFHVAWINGRARHGDEQYPRDLPEGEWDDQFQLFLNREGK